MASKKKSGSGGFFWFVITLVLIVNTFRLQAKIDKMDNSIASNSPTHPLKK